MNFAIWVFFLVFRHFYDVTVGGEIVRSTSGFEFPVGEDVGCSSAKFEPLPVVTDKSYSLLTYSDWIIGLLVNNAALSTPLSSRP